MTIVEFINKNHKNKGKYHFCIIYKSRDFINTNKKISIKKLAQIIGVDFACMEIENVYRSNSVVTIRVKDN